MEAIARTSLYTCAVKAISRGALVQTINIPDLCTLLALSDNYITVEISNLGDKPVESVVQRTAVTSVLPKGTIKAL